MTKEIILDKDINQEFQEYLFDKESIIWEGKPNSKITITLLELGGYYDVTTGPISILAFLLTIIGYWSYTYYEEGNILGSILSLILGFTIGLLPDLIKHIRKRNTKYAFTENRILFKLWRWGKESVHMLDFDDIGKITYEEYEDKSGIIHFMAKQPLNFCTYDFITGSRRIYPTFELVSEVIELRDILENYRRNKIKKEASH